MNPLNAFAAAVTQVSGLENTYPAWSPDGTKNRLRVDARLTGRRDGSNATRVTFGDGVDGRGSWTKPWFSADGKRILCTRSLGTSVDIFVVELK